MKIKVFLLLLFLPFITVSCNLEKVTELLRLYNDAKEKNQKSVQKEENISYEEASRQLALYWAITTWDVDEVRKYMEEGYDPNKSLGEGWADKTPLNVVVRGFYDTFARLEIGRAIPDPPPDVEIIQLLVDAGANVNERPNIWCRIYRYDNFGLESVKETKRSNKENLEAALTYVKDANRVIETLLKAGTDPDMLGHPYPYSLEARRSKITDEEAAEYFAKGTRPINEAIKKGIRWESQVDLLLQYTTLDKDSLKAAKESKDPVMIEKITRLWNEQNGGR